MPVALQRNLTLSVFFAWTFCAAPAFSDVGGDAIDRKTIHINAAGATAIVSTWTDATGREQFTVSADGGTTFSEPRRVDHTLRLRAFQVDPRNAQWPSELPLLAQRAASRKTKPIDESSRLYIVQFITPPGEAMLRRVEQTGAKLGAFLPESAQIVEMTAAQQAEVQSLEIVRWIGPFHSAFRLEQALVNELSKVPSMPGDSAKALARIPTRRYSIMLFERGAQAQQKVQQRIAEVGGVVHAAVRDGFRMEATLTAQQLLEIALMNEVQFIDMWGPAGVDMDVARQIGGAVPLLSGLGFTGQGVRGEVMDDGIRLSHSAFANPAPIVHSSNPPVLSHGTATFGIVFGNGAGNASGTGLLPNREQGIFATYFDLISNGGSTSRYTHTAELVNPSMQYKAVFQSNSWGGGLTTQYTSTSAEFDDILFINDILTCQSQSNQASLMSRPEAWSKNTVSVGGVSHFNTLSYSDDQWTTASFGPAADGRIKPDLTHFYDNVLCPHSSSNTAYTAIFNGTSAATPIVCGYFGLLFQMWHEGVFTGFGGSDTVFNSRPRMATAKALVINSAYRYNWQAGGANSNLTRAKQGWGMPNFTKLYNDRDQTFIVNEEFPLQWGQNKSFSFIVPVGQPELRVTLAYTDPMGNPAANKALVNDLTLKVTAPNGSVYWGNYGLVGNNFSLPGGSPDTINNVENVFLANPSAGNWTFSVTADFVVADAVPGTVEFDAAFALVIAGVTVPQPCPGDISGDNVVNVADLLAVITQWGVCGGCAADVTGDGVVNVGDLLLVISHWGACP